MTDSRKCPFGAAQPQVPEMTAEEEGSWLFGAIETAVDAIVTINGDGLIAYTNPAAQRLFGWSAGEMRGQNVSMLMPEPFRSAHDGYLAHYLETGQRRIIGIGREVRGVRSDGSEFPLHLSVSEVNIGGKPIFTGILRDITHEQREAEEKDRLLRELREQNKKNACLYSAGEVLSRGESEAEVFPELARLIAPACYDPDQVRGRIVFDGESFSGGDFQPSPRVIAAAIHVAGRERGRVEAHLLDTNPSPEARAFEEADHNLLRAIAARLGERLERRQAEAQVIQASKLAAIGELAAGVSHEINNPINGIINCADIILKHPDLDPNVRRFAELLRSEADRIAAIVRNLLTFSRQEKERHSLARLCDIVESTLSLTRKRIAKSHIALQTNIPDDLPKLKCRSEQLQQVLMNLIINAVHALDERFPGPDPMKTLEISARALDEGGATWLRLTVADQGKGIAPEHRDRLFDPFFTTKGRDKGTGLGLSVSDGIVKAHGGLIRVESEPMRYARFHVDLPLNEAWDLEQAARTKTE